MIPSPGAWAQQQETYTAVYAAQLPAQLRRVIDLVHERRAGPDTLAPYFDSCLALLERASAPQLSALWLELVAALHPLPLRWRRWEEWARVLTQAAERSAAAGDGANQARYLAAQAGLLRHFGRLEEALTTARTAVDLAAAARAPLPLAEAGSTAVAALRFQARMAEAETLLAELSRSLYEISAGEPPALALSQLDLQRMDLLRSAGNLPEAVELADHILAPLEKEAAPDTHLLAGMLRRRATIYWAAGRYPAAVSDLQRSAALFELASDPLEALFSRGNLGLVYYSMAKYDEAEAHIRAVIAAGEEMHATWRLIRDVGNLAAVYLARGELDTAARYAERHLDLATASGDGAERSRATSNLTAIRAYLGEVAASLPGLQAVYDDFRAQGRPESLLAAQVDLAVAWHLLGDQEACLDHALAVLAHPTAARVPTLRILGLRALALCAAPDEARAALREALALAREHGRRLDEAACLLSLAALDESREAELWAEGAELLHEIGAPAWLDGRSPANPPLVALIL